MNERLNAAGRRIDLIGRRLHEENKEAARAPSSKCQRCSQMVPEVLFETHDKICPWVCGLCGVPFTSWQDHATHSMRCSRWTPSVKATPTITAVP